jgi:hypothetical protein
MPLSVHAPAPISKSTFLLLEPLMLSTTRKTFGLQPKPLF